MSSSLVATGNIDTAATPYSYVRAEDVAALSRDNILSNLETVPPIKVQYGDTTVVSSDQLAYLGEFPTVVMSRQADTLISPTFALDAGGSLFLKSAGGVLSNASNTSSIPITRVGDQWRCDLSSVAAFNTNVSTPQVNGNERVNGIALSTRVANNIMFERPIDRPLLDPAILARLRSKHLTTTRSSSEMLTMLAESADVYSSNLTSNLASQTEETTVSSSLTS